MTTQPRVPTRAWVVTASGTIVNLCLGILYAWSVWKSDLVAKADLPAGSAMAGHNEGWSFLSDAEATWAYAVCGLTFSAFMIPGGRLQDRYGPKTGATLAGLFLGAGCLVAGLMKSFAGLILGFGLLGGIGMGLGYAAATPAAVRWFGPHRRGLIAGLVVGGYGAAAIYISPLARQLIDGYGLSGSFIALGVLFGTVIIVAGRLLSTPPPGYAPPAAAVNRVSQYASADWETRDMLGTWQYYALVFLFVGSAQAGLLVIANAAPILKGTASSVPFFAANAWLLASYGGFVNASGRIGTGFYSDLIGRVNGFALNGIVATACLVFIPSVIADRNIPLLFLLVGGVLWQYGGTLALMPALTADYFGSKNLGLNYGLVFLGWGVAFLVPQAAGYLRDATDRPGDAFYLSAGLLMVAVVVSRLLKKPLPPS